MISDEVFLAYGACEIAQDHMPGKESAPIKLRRYESRRKGLIGSMARIFIRAENPDDTECQIAQEFEKCVSSDYYTWRDRVIARGVFATLVAEARQAAEAMPQLRGEDNCDPGGGPMTPEYRDLDEPW